MLTGTIHRLCIPGNSQGRQARGPTFLDKRQAHAGGGGSFSLSPRQAASLCHFQGRLEKMLPRHTSRQMHTEAASNSSVSPWLSWDAQKKKEEAAFSFSLWS